MVSLTRVAHAIWVAYWNELGSQSQACVAHVLDWLGAEVGERRLGVETNRGGGDRWEFVGGAERPRMRKQGFKDEFSPVKIGADFQRVWFFDEGTGWARYS